MTTVYIHAPAAEHDFPNHPENAERGPAVWSLLEEQGLFTDLLIKTPQPADAALLRAVHTSEMLHYMEEVCLRGGGRIDQDTYATEFSYNLARIAAGAVCQGVELIVKGTADNGYVFVRPPGHHAEIRRPGGFCLINNIAVGARYAQHILGFDRVAIIDFDVHHGNGTQDIFYDDPSVLFISSHQYTPYFYPGTGGLNETGIGDGSGSTMNLPLPAGVGDQGFKLLYDQLVGPKLEQFKPDLLLVSAGFDAHWVDPLAQLELSLTGYGELCRQIITWSQQLCDGKILFVQEGGYVLEALSHGVLNTVLALLGRDRLIDPLGPSSGSEPELERTMTAVRGLHLI